MTDHPNPVWTTTTTSRFFPTLLANRSNTNDASDYYYGQFIRQLKLNTNRFLGLTTLNNQLIIDALNISRKTLQTYDRAVDVMGEIDHKCIL
jgi:hypothetical protein